MRTFKLLAILLVLILAAFATRASEGQHIKSPMVYLFGVMSKGDVHARMVIGPMPLSDCEHAREQVTRLNHVPMACISSASVVDELADNRCDLVQGGQTFNDVPGVGRVFLCES